MSVHRSSLLRASACVSLVLVCACTQAPAPKQNAESKPATQPDATPEPTTPEPTAPEPTAPEPTAPAPDGLELGPRESAAPEARTEAVLALLSDGESAAALPLYSSDPGVVFAPNLVVTLQPRPPAAQVRAAETEVSAGLDREIVDRIIRVHMQELRRCYERALADDPALVGRVTVEFEITADGAVGRSKPHAPKLGTVGECMAKAVRRWRFKAPEGDASVQVRATFDLQSGSLL